MRLSQLKVTLVLKRRRCRKKTTFSHPLLPFKKKKLSVLALVCWGHWLVLREAADLSVMWEWCESDVRVTCRHLEPVVPSCLSCPVPCRGTCWRRSSVGCEMRRDGRLAGRHRCQGWMALIYPGVMAAIDQWLSLTTSLALSAKRAGERKTPRQKINKNLSSDTLSKEALIDVVGISYIIYCNIIQ